MDRVVVPSYQMVYPETYRRVLDGVATVEEVEMSSVEDLLAAAADADAAVVTVGISVPAEAMAELSHLRALARSSVGVAGIDVAAASDHGIAVLHAPEYCRDEVATHSVALLLACVRAIPEYDRAVRDGDWPRTPPSRPLYRLAGDTVGLVAYGRIARSVRERLRGFGVDVVAHDPYVSAEAMAADGVERVGREELFARADHVSVHAPDTPETRNLVDADAFAALSDRGVVVNTGRGSVVDEAALADALDAGELACAGLDVFEAEPLPDDSPLRGRDDVVLTPHAAWYSEDSRAEVNETVAEDIRRVLTGENPVYAADEEWM